MNLEQLFDKHIPIRKHGVYGTGNISIQTLGNWAWEQALISIDENIKYSCIKKSYFLLEEFLQPNEFDEFGIDYIGICVACFGEEAIEKKLLKYISQLPMNKKLKEGVEQK